MADTLYGADISNHQGPPATYRGQPWYQESQFIIAQAIPRPLPDGYVGEQLRAAQADGKHCGAYVWLWHDPTWRMGDGSVEDDQRRRLATIPDDVQLDMRLWLDVEDNQSTGWKVPIPQRVDDVKRALAVLDEWSAARGLPAAGIYWSDWFISLLFGGQDYFGRRQWKAHYGAPAGSLIHDTCVAHQYTSTPVDQNIMLASEIVTAGAPPATDPCAGLVTALAYLGDDLPPRLEAAMKGKMTAADKTEVLAVAAELRRVREQFIGPKS
jgi:hypothetical protein